MTANLNTVLHAVKCCEIRIGLDILLLWVSLSTINGPAISGNAGRNPQAFAAQFSAFSAWLKIFPGVAFRDVKKLRVRHSCIFMVCSTL